MFGVLAAKTGENIDILKHGKITELNNLLPSVRKLISETTTIRVIEMKEEDIGIMMCKQDLIQSMLEDKFE